MPPFVDSPPPHEPTIPYDLDLSSPLERSHPSCDRHLPPRRHAPHRSSPLLRAVALFARRAFASPRAKRSALPPFIPRPPDDKPASLAPQPNSPAIRRRGGLPTFIGASANHPPPSQHQPRPARLRISQPSTLSSQPFLLPVTPRSGSPHSHRPIPHSPSPDPRAHLHSGPRKSRPQFCARACHPGPG